MKLFRIKICGVTNLADAEIVAAAGADAIGLNFYPRSARFVEPAVAAGIVQALPREIQKVGVFVNAPVRFVRETADRLPLDLVQLHGDEPPEFIRDLNGRPTIRAFRCRSPDLSPVALYLQRCQQLGVSLRAVLLDAFRQDQYGGTGQSLDWDQLRPQVALVGYLPVVLSGGLTAANVGQAIARLKPHAVDTASGVESAPGRKDAARVRAFVQAAQAAW